MEFYSCAVYDSIYYYITMSGVERGRCRCRERGSVVYIVLPSTTGGAGWRCLNELVTSCTGE